MKANSKAGATNTGSKPKTFLIAGGNQKRFDHFYYRQFDNYGQSARCRKCKSDYMKFSLNGYCQNCIQKVEFIVREYPNVARDARNQKAEVAAV